MKVKIVKLWNFKGAKTINKYDYDCIDIERFVLPLVSYDQYELRFFPPPANFGFDPIFRLRQIENLLLEKHSYWEISSKAFIHDIAVTDLDITINVLKKSGVKKLGKVFGILSRPRALAVIRRDNGKER